MGKDRPGGRMNFRESIEKYEAKQREEKGLVCKGLLFRGYSSLYYDNDGKIERKEGLRLLKRKSCNAFEDCGSYAGDVLKMRCDWWMLDEMREAIDCEGVIFPEIEDKALYRLRVVNETYDWESGYCDGYDLEFYKVEENDSKE